jgi:hypothetical protein
MSVAWSSPNNKRGDGQRTLNVTVAFPQTYPLPRTNVTIALHAVTINVADMVMSGRSSSALTRHTAKTSTVLPFTYQSTVGSVEYWTLNTNIGDLISNGYPSSADFLIYRLYMWNVSITWSEAVAPDSASKRRDDAVVWNRQVDQSMPFVVAIQSYVRSDGSLSLTTPTVHYAIIRNTQLVIDMKTYTAMFTVTFQTIPVDTTKNIPEDQITISAYTGRMINVSTPTLVSTTSPNTQVWQTQVMFNICDYGASNAFVVRVRLAPIGERRSLKKSLSEAIYLPISLTAINNNLCSAPGVVIGVSGTQTTYFNSFDFDDVANPPVATFWLRDVVHVRVAWLVDDGVQVAIASSKVYAVILSGTALRSTALEALPTLPIMEDTDTDIAMNVSIVYYLNTTDDTEIVNNDAYEYTEVTTGTGTCGTSTACYSFVASPDMLNTPTDAGLTLNIITISRITYQDGSTRMAMTKTAKTYSPPKVADPMATTSLIRLYSTTRCSGAVTTTATVVGTWWIVALVTLANLIF